MGLLLSVFGGDTMKIGDLVRWHPAVRYEENEKAVGLIIAYTLEYEGYDAWMVQWSGGECFQVDPKHLEKIQ